MLRKPLLTLTLALLLAAGFCFGLARLFALRFESGDVYPAYSTLRADPLGAKGIYEAIAQLPGVEARRNFRPLKKLQPGRPITIVYLGTSHSSYWTERELEEFETLMANGARAVFAFFPFDRPPMPSELRHALDEQRDKKRKRLDEEKDKEGGDKDSKRTDEDDEKKSGMVSFEKVAKRFGFQFDFLPAEEGKMFDRHAFLFETGGSLERDLSWHSALCFKDLAPEWKPLYLSETKPVIMERSYGRGSIVLASDSFLFSNEALRKERHAQLLSRVFSGPPVIVFDEEHLGVTDQPGVAQLALKYHLHGVIAGLVLIAALFVWKNSVRFIPAYPEASADGDVVSGRDASQGFSNLLHRAIKPADLLGVCVEEWRRAFARKGATVAHVQEILAREETLPAKKRDPVAAYREISRRLSRKTHP